MTVDMDTSDQIRKISGCLAGTVLPYLALRCAAVSAGPFEHLIFRQTATTTDRVLDIERSLREIAEGLPDVLYKAIGTLGLGDFSHEIIQLRRDIYNGRKSQRPLSAEASALLAGAVSPTELERIKQYLQRHLEHESLQRDGERIFAEELASARMALKRSLQKREFRKGLALASPALSYELDQYIQAVEREVRRIRRTERSLIRYYSRVVFKPSPFSSFVRGSLVRFGDSKNPTRKLPPRAHSHAALNRSLIASMAKCIAQHSELGSYAPVRLSTTYLHQEEKLLLLQRSFGEVTPTLLRTPRESSVTVSHNAAMEWIKGKIFSNGGQMRLRDLISGLQSSLPESSQGEAYIHKLIDIGFLIHKIPLRDTQSSGLENLICFLDCIPSSLATSVRQQLACLGRSAAQFASADAQRRRVLLQEMLHVTSHIFSLLGIPPADWTNLIVFEDHNEEQLTHIPVPSRWRPALEDLSGFLSLYASLFDRNLSLRMAVAEVLNNRFASGPVGLIEFLHCFFATPQSSGKDIQPSVYDHTPFNQGSERMRALATLREEIGHVIAAGSSTEELDFGELAEQHQWLNRLSALNVASSEALVISIACHCQPVERADDGTNIVVNGFFDGAMNACLRACTYLVEPERNQVIQELQRTLSEAYSPSIPCELAATFDFNVNLHPQITEEIIDSLDEDTGSSESIKLKDLMLHLSPDGRIALFHRQRGKEITALHLGMMAVRFAGLTQHFLSGLSSICMISSKPFHPYHWRSDPQRKPVEVFPRIVFGRCLLRRKGWSVLPEVLPRRTHAEGDFHYFLRVQRWRRDFGIPNEGFVLAGESSPDRDSRKTWNSRKPQYIHFENSFFLDVFSQLVTDTTKRIYIEEVLPHRTEWKRHHYRRTMEAILGLCIVKDRESAAATRRDAR